MNDRLFFVPPLNKESRRASRRRDSSPTPPRGSPDRHQVEQLDTDKTGQVYVLGGSGILAAYNSSAEGFSPAILQGDPQVQVVVDGSGQLYSRDTNGTVYAVNGDNATAVDSLVQSISLDTSGKLSETYTPIGIKWHDLGGASSFLGNPIGIEESVVGGSLEDFRGGEITLSSIPGSIAYAIPSVIAKQYDQVGGPASYLGLATTDALPLTDINGNTVGSAVYFQDGAIFAGANGYVTDMTSHVSDLYKMNLGVPVSREASVGSDVEEVTFTNGAIYWSPITGGKVFQFDGTDPALTPTGGWALAGNTVGYALHQPLGISFSAEGTLSLNLDQQTAYADLNFDGVHFDSNKIEDLLQGEFVLPRIDPMEVLSSLSQSTVKSNYEALRDANYLHYGAANVYFSSERFVDWASPQTVGQLVGQAVLGAGDASVSEIKDNLGAEMQNLIAWATRSFGSEAQAVQALSAVSSGGVNTITAKVYTDPTNPTSSYSVSALQIGKVEIIPVKVTYTYGLLGKSVPETHYGYEIVIPSSPDFPPDSSLLPQSSLIGTDVAAAPATQGVSQDDLQNDLVKLATSVFNKALGTNLDPSSFDLGGSIASNLVNTALYKRLYTDLGVSPSILKNAYNGDPVIDLTKVPMPKTLALILSSAVNSALGPINDKLKDINGKVRFEVDQLDFNTSTYELTAKVKLTFSDSLGNPLDVLNHVGSTLSNLGKTEAAKAGSWFQQEAGDLAKWYNDLAPSSPIILLPLGNWAQDAVNQLPDAVQTLDNGVQNGINTIQTTVTSLATAAKNSPVGKAVSNLFSGLNLVDPTTGDLPLQT